MSLNDPVDLISGEYIMEESRLAHVHSSFILYLDECDAGDDRLVLGVYEGDTLDCLLDAGLLVREERFSLRAEIKAGPM